MKALLWAYRFLLLCHHVLVAGMPYKWGLQLHTERGVETYMHCICSQHSAECMSFYIAGRFATALTGPPREVSLATDSKKRPRRVLHAIAVAALVVWEVAADVARAVWLLVLFAPLAVTAPFTLNGARRQEWLQYLRHAHCCWQYVACTDLHCIPCGGYCSGLCCPLQPFAASPCHVRQLPQHAMICCSIARMSSWCQLEGGGVHKRAGKPGMVRAAGIKQCNAWPRRMVLEAAGPAFIKWGQWAATRHDMFPPDFCAALEQLHTQVGMPDLARMPAPAASHLSPSVRQPELAY